MKLVHIAKPARKPGWSETLIFIAVQSATTPAMGPDEVRKIHAQLLLNEYVLLESRVGSHGWLYPRRTAGSRVGKALQKRHFLSLPVHGVISLETLWILFPRVILLPRRRERLHCSFWFHELRKVEARANLRRTSSGRRKKIENSRNPEIWQEKAAPRMMLKGERLTTSSNRRRVQENTRYDECTTWCSSACNA